MAFSADFREKVPTSFGAAVIVVSSVCFCALVWVLISHSVMVCTLFIQVKTENPTLKMLEIGQQLAKLWKEADEETKVHFGCSGVHNVLKGYSAFSGGLCSCAASPKRHTPIDGFKRASLAGSVCDCRLSTPLITRKRWTSTTRSLRHTGSQLAQPECTPTLAGRARCLVLLDVFVSPFVLLYYY